MKLLRPRLSVFVRGVCLGQRPGTCMHTAPPHCCERSPFAHATVRIRWRGCRPSQQRCITEYPRADTSCSGPMGPVALFTRCCLQPCKTAASDAAHVSAGPERRRWYVCEARPRRLTRSRAPHQESVVSRCPPPAMPDAKCILDSVSKALKMRENCGGLPAYGAAGR